MVILGFCIFLSIIFPETEGPIGDWRSLPLVTIVVFFIFEYYFLKQEDSFVSLAKKRIKQLLYILLLYYLIVIPLLFFGIQPYKEELYIVFGGTILIFFVILLIFYFLRELIKLIALKYVKTFTDLQVIQHIIIMLAIWLLVAWVFAMLYSFWPSSILKEGEIFIERDNLDNLYFSITTLTSLGYGDINPVGWGKTIACGEVLTGYFLLSLTVGILGWIVIEKFKSHDKI